MAMNLSFGTIGGGGDFCPASYSIDSFPVTVCDAILGTIHADAHQLVQCRFHSHSISPLWCPILPLNRRISDYELLTVVLMILGIIVSILIAYINHTKK